MKVKIHDLSNGDPKVYIAEKVSDCHDNIDKIVYNTVCDTGDVITLGQVIGEPISE
jgi:methylmalonyl-CoA mutase cobalamin-binding subunit